MNTHQMLYDHLKDEGAFTTEMHPTVLSAMDCISVEAPYKMKMAIALTELIAFTSHLRKPIRLMNGTEVPVNCISFILAKSGVSKDSSMNMVRDGLTKAYTLIDEVRKDDAIERARRKAVIEGKKEEMWQQFYVAPRELLAGLATQEGLMAHFASLESGKHGGGYIQSSEIGTELLTNGNMTDIIKTVAIAYDLGKIPAKIIKSDEHQTPAIKSLPVSALLFGSEDAILYEDPVKNKFRTIFSTQLARRSFPFNYNPTIPEQRQFESIPELVTFRAEQEEASIKAQVVLENLTVDLVKDTSVLSMPLSESAQALFYAYKEYNALEADMVSKLYPMTAISRRHKQWVALKVAGAFTILDGSEILSADSYLYAIRIVEFFSNDLQEFETELIKEAYELFVQYMQYIEEDGEAEMTIHQLRKMGYITTTGNPDAKVKELVTLASSYDAEGIYSADKTGIHYKKIIKVDAVGVSFEAINIDGIEHAVTKQQKDDFKHKIAKRMDSFDYAEVAFDQLGDLLSDDMAYTPFRLKDGKRGKDNVMGGIKFIVLDVDESMITDEECHLLLEGVNHYITRSFDLNNAFKFKVLVELDTIVELDDKAWKHFMSAVADYLGIKVDLLPKSQIFFSYSNGDRKILKELKGEPLETKPHILMAESKRGAKSSAIALSKPQIKALLGNPMDTFSFAYDAPDGEGSRQMMRAAYYMKDLQVEATGEINHDEIIELIEDINNFWSVPMEEDRLHKTIISQIARW